MIVGIIAIPLGMAFSIASGVKPEYGIYTTIVTGILISVLDGSRYQIGGPTGAFVPLLFAIVMKHGYYEGGDGNRRNSRSLRLNRNVGWLADRQEVHRRTHSRPHQTIA